VTMTRQELDQRLVEYLFDELSDEEATHFEESVTDYPELEAEVAAHRMINAAAAELPEMTMSPSVMDAVMAAATAAVAPVQPQQSWLESLLTSLMQPAMVTAMLFVAVGATSVFVVSQEAPVSGSSAKTMAMADEHEDMALAAVDSAPRALEPEVASPAEERVAAAVVDSAARDREFKAVIPKVSARLVEVDGTDKRLRDVAIAEGARPARMARSRSGVGGLSSSSSGRASKKARAKTKTKTKALSKVQPMKIAEARQAMAPSVAAMARRQAPPAAALASRAQAVAAASGARPAAPAPARLDARTGYATRGHAEPPPASPPAAEDDAVQEQAKKGTPTVAVQAKRLVSEFERHLRKGNSPGAVKALERLADLPGFAETAKRKRTELRKWMQARSKSKASKKGSAKPKAKAKAKR
jgi:anti-sigma factor RsiW